MTAVSRVQASLTKFGPVVLGAAAFVGAVLLVGPFGDFPLNDDWSFAQTAARLATEGEFRPIGWAAMTLLSNAIWGAAFCLFGGCTFDVLRLSTLVIGWLGGVGIWLTLRELQTSPWVSLLAVLSLLFNPLYFALAHTFMTDVPFTAFLIWAAYFLLRYLRTDAVRDLVAGVLLCTVAVLSRQVALVIPLAFVPALILARGLSFRCLVIAITPLVIVLGALLTFDVWLDYTGRTPSLYGAPIDRLAKNLAEPKSIKHMVQVLHHAYLILCYLGLMLLPVMLLTGWPQMQTRRLQRWAMLAVLMLLALAFVGLFRYEGSLQLMPLVGNIVGPTGIGPLTLRDSYILEFDSVQPLPTWFWFGVTALSLLGAALLLGTVLAQISALVRQPRGAIAGATAAAAVFYLVAAVIYLSPLLLTHIFDRYLIPVIALLIPGLFALRRVAGEDCTPRRPILLAVLLWISATAGFSVAGTHDWLAWNRARWEALAALEVRGATADEIDGGFEFNGLRSFERPPPPNNGNSWWWVHDDRYIVAFGPVPGYREVAVYNYDRWLSGGTARVVVLERL